LVRTINRAEVTDPANTNSHDSLNFEERRAYDHSLLLLPNLVRPGAISPFLTESHPAKLYLQIIC